MRCDAVHQLGDLVLLPETAGAADQAVRVGGNRDHQRVEGPCRQVVTDRGDCRLSLSVRTEVKNCDVTRLARGKPDG